MMEVDTGEMDIVYGTMLKWKDLVSRDMKAWKMIWEECTTDTRTGRDGKVSGRPATP